MQTSVLSGGNRPAGVVQIACTFQNSTDMRCEVKLVHNTRVDSVLPWEWAQATLAGSSGSRPSLSAWLVSLGYDALASIVYEEGMGR